MPQIYGRNINTNNINTNTGIICKIIRKQPNTVAN